MILKKNIYVSFIMYKNIILFGVLLFLSNCNQHNLNNISSFSYQEKPFKIKWKIEKKSITNIPMEVQKKVKNICKKYNRFVLFKIKTFTGNLYCLIVDISCIFIKIDASPATSITKSFGCASCTPRAAGSP